MKSRPLRIVTALAAAVLGLLASGPAKAQLADPDAVLPPASAPEPDLPSSAAQVNLALTGTAITGVFYGAALGSSLIWNRAPWSTEMKIPVVGPWLSLKDIKCGDEEPNCTTLLVVVRAVMMSIDGVGQAGGLAIIAESLFLPKRPDLPKKRSEPLREKSLSATLHPFPLVIGDAVGIGLAGEL